MLSSKVASFLYSKYVALPWPAVMHTPLLQSRCYHKQREEEKPDILLGLAELFSKRSINVDFLSRLHQIPHMTLDMLREKRKLRTFEKRVYDQRYIPERHGILGPDLAAAAFLLHRGASVKFVGKEEWYKKKEDEETGLPIRHEEGWNLEAIDASETELIYEGFENLVHLGSLKALRLCGCPFIDDWCVDRLSQFQDTLEHLDLSGCTQITERGLSSLYRLTNLKSVTLGYLPQIKNLNLVAVLLEDCLPQCEIRGVDYWQPRLVSENIDEHGPKPPDPS
ncbi:distal membrane-arm assembly complex protein 2-like [Ornithodoros turicata]